MSRRRFYAPPGAMIDSCIDLSKGETHHLVRVLRMKAGDEAFVFDGCGAEYRCRFVAMSNNCARLEIVETLGSEVESPARITLAQALAKGERFDLVVQKATELGVSSIVPLVTEHTDVKLAEESSQRRLERWRRVSLEAIKQCGRRRLVEISSPLTPEQFCDSSAGRFEAVLLFSERGGELLASALKGVSGSREIAALIGSEGGWSDDELELLASRGAKPVTLGPRVLRTETAAIVAVTLLQHALGDLSR
ncbi:MAG TPA: 16S rRNA (uracil(1498)-N(3))-methyltransferase [Blastocatellia bacterium]|nr:16S rRNA (uracil(1498)-N(3))-methyltransferase [Blastocatellia bacterium]